MTTAFQWPFILCQVQQTCGVLWQTCVH